MNPMFPFRLHLQLLEHKKCSVYKCKQAHDMSLNSVLCLMFLLGVLMPANVAGDGVLHQRNLMNMTRDLQELDPYVSSQSNLSISTCCSLNKLNVRLDIP